MICALALITYRVYPSLMGGQKGVTSFYQHLQKEIPVVAAVSTNNEPTENAPFPIKKCLYSNKWVFLNIFRIGVLKKLVQQYGVTILVAEHSYTGWIALLLKKRTGLPFAIHSHNLEADRFRKMGRWWWWLYRLYEKWIHQKADINFFISDADKQLAIKQFGLDAARCKTITYGVEKKATLFTHTKKELLTSLELPPDCILLFFNGTLDYTPNIEALHLLINEVAPRLDKHGQLFKILISGNRISPALLQTITAQPHFQYLGYVPDVTAVYRSVDLFINPIQNNTGVKTKLIEAMANHCSAVSTQSGASGINTDVCGEKLILAEDGNWNAFTNCIIAALQQPSFETPQTFFDTYLWANIVKKAALNLRQCAV